jgi:hypothetical protein
MATGLGFTCLGSSWNSTAGGKRVAATFGVARAVASVAVVDEVAGLATEYVPRRQTRPRVEASAMIGSWKKATKGGSRTSYLVACWPPSRKKSEMQTPPMSQSMEGNTESSASA